VNSEILYGSEILHGAGTYSGGSNLGTNLFVCDCLIVSIYLFIIHSFLSINTHLNKIAIEHINSYLEESRGEVLSPSRKFQFHVLFWVIDCIIHLKLIRICIWLAIHLFTPPLGVISIGNRALVFRIWLNHLREILVANHFANLFILIHYSKISRRH